MTPSPPFEAQHPKYAESVAASFAKQGLMRSIEAALVSVLPGAVEIALPYRNDLTQQHGAIHAGVITAIVDTACGYAALTLMPPDAEVVTVEYKVNFLAPAAGDRVIGRGQVIRSGAELSVCRGEVVVTKDGEDTLVATMLATMLRV